LTELKSLENTLNILPQNLAKEFIELWKEFEAGLTPDAKFAKSVDRLPPLLHNINDNGHSWKNNNISKEQVFSVNSKKYHQVVWRYGTQSRIDSMKLLRPVLCRRYVRIRIIGCGAEAVA